MPIAECQMPNCSAAHARQRVLIRDSANERFYKTKICDLRSGTCLAPATFFLPLPRSGGGEGRGEGESLFQSWKSLLSPALSSMGWRRGRRGTLNSYYVGDYHPVAADVSPRQPGDSRDCREFIGSMLLRRGAQILLRSAATPIRSTIPHSAFRILSRSPSDHFCTKVHHAIRTTNHTARAAQAFPSLQPAGMG